MRRLKNLVKSKLVSKESSSMLLAVLPSINIWQNYSTKAILMEYNLFSKPWWQYLKYCKRVRGGLETRKTSHLTGDCGCWMKSRDSSMRRSLMLSLSFFKLLLSKPSKWNYYRKSDLRRKNTCLTKICQTAQGRRKSRSLERISPKIFWVRSTPYWILN